MKIIPIIFLLFFFGCNTKTNNFDPTQANNTTQNSEIGVLVTTRGTFEIQFYNEKAPNTVKRIKELIGSKFYDGIQFHRVISNFVIQAGDPTGTGVGGSGKKINAEFNDILHVKGTVAMARLGHDVNSADSQFYIALSTLPHLDKNYTVFGKVVDGLEKLNLVEKGDRIISFRLKQ